MNYANLIQNITENIKTNGSQAITAQVLQDVLVDMVGELGQSGALLGGVIDTSFVPDLTNDAQVVYIAESPGTYTNFNGLVVGAGEVAFFYFNGNAWAKSSVDVLEVVNNLNSTATDKALSAAMGKQIGDNISQLGQEVNGLTSIIDKQVGINLYDGNGTVDGQYVVGAIVPIDANNEKLVLSTAGKNAAYFYSQKFVDANGVETEASYENQGYSANEQRHCQRFAIPTNAKYFKFSYRFTSASISVLVHDVMVTYGTTYYNDFYPYEEGYSFKNPYFKPYADYLNTPVYVSPSGNDSNNGTIDSPFYTFGRALSTGRDIVVRGGLYPYQSSRSFVAISFGSSPYRKVKISAYEGETPIILAGIKLAETATLMQGSTKVYEKTVALNPNSKWIFQYGIPDTNTLIQESERTTYHKGRDVRNPYCTAMRLVGSIAEVESNENYTYFYDSDAGKIYFSCPEVPTADNPIYMADISAFAGASGKELHISGLVILGGAFYIKGCVDSYIESVTVVGSRLGAGFTLDDVTNCTLVKCEASFIDAGASSFGGDGFNAHGTIKTDFRLIDCYSHDNNNDGYSDHENCYGIIQGGLFEHNCIGGQGGGITPAYGACDEIRDVISQNNLADGIRYSSQSGATKNGVIVMNSVSRNNAQNGYHTDSVAKMDLINCVAYGNARGFKGNAAQNILAINSKSVGNTNADEYVTII